MKYIKPIGYKTFHWKQSKSKPKNITDLSNSSSSPICINKIVEDPIQIELSSQYECFDIDFTGKPNYVKIYGIRVVVHNEKTQKTIIIQGLVDDVPLDCITNSYLKYRKKEILDTFKETDFYNDPKKVDLINRLLETITIKDSLIIGNSDFCKRLITILSDVNYVRITKLTSTIRKFVDMDIYEQRNMIMNLLLYNQEDDIQYITYLLYDLISTKSSNGSSVDSSEQQIMYDSFPWKLKLYFKDTMKQTIKYTKDMMNKYDINRVSLEQQIYVMKVPENVREKAMSKLKEIKGKSDDSGAKAKQYLEGLIKIPFGVYREEPILKKPKMLNSIFLGSINSVAEQKRNEFISKYMNSKIKSHYSALEILQLSEKIENWTKSMILNEFSENLSGYSTKQLNQIWTIFCSEYKTGDNELYDKKQSSVTKQVKQRILRTHLDKCPEILLSKMYDSIVLNVDQSYQKPIQDIQKSKSIANEFKHDLKNVVDILDESIYGHETAKNQILNYYLY
jgi:hypothetical protein